MIEHTILLCLGDRLHPETASAITMGCQELETRMIWKHEPMYPSAALVGGEDIVRHPVGTHPRDARPVALHARCAWDPATDRYAGLRPRPRAWPRGRRAYNGGGAHPFARLLSCPPQPSTTALPEAGALGHP